MNKKRVGILLDQSLEEEIRKIQAKLIEDSNKWFSFSLTINHILSPYFENHKIENQNKRRDLDQICFIWN